MIRGSGEELSLSLRKKIGLAAGKFKMISPGDKVMIGLSGGKDSLVLAVALTGLRRRSPAPFSLAACLVDITGGQRDVTALKEFCDRLEIPFHVRPHPTLDIIESRKERSPCSLCANLRQGILNGAARDSGFNVLALGHNLDDAAETVLMNLFHTGRFKAFLPKFRQSRSGTTVIRPMVFAEEKKIEREARRLALPVAPYVCPFSLDTERSRTKRLLGQIDADNPRVKYNIIRALQNLNEGDRWCGAETDLGKQGPAPEK